MNSDARPKYGYFEALVHECNLLDAKGQAYLDTLNFLSNDEICQRIWTKAKELYREAGGEDDGGVIPDSLPEWAQSTLDGWIPYSMPPRNGSLFYALGYSVVSADAHLRNLLEQVEGRTDKDLDFPVLVDENFYDKYEVKPVTPVKSKRKKKA